MDDNDFDFQPRKPIIYDEKDFAEVQAIHDNTPLAEHHRVDDIMQINAALLDKQYPDAATLLGAKDNIFVADEPEHQKAIAQASPRDAANSIPVGANLDPSLTTPNASQSMLDPNNPVSPMRPFDGSSSGDSAEPPGGYGVSSAGAGAGASSRAEKPSDLESALSAIRMDTERQKRFVILGDESIKRNFLAKLEERGQVYYSGGCPVITIGRAKAIATLREVSAARDGAVVHAVNLRLDREGGGPLAPELSFRATLDNIRGAYDSVKAGVKNAIGRQHEVSVVVVGNQATVTAKLAEVGKFVEELDKRKLLHHGLGSGSDSSDALKRNGNGGPSDASGAGHSLDLQALSKKGPVELVGTTSLGTVMQVARDKVMDYNSEKASKQAELKEHEQETKLKKMEADKLKESGVPPADKPEPVKKFVGQLAKDLADGFQDTSTLATVHADKKTQAETLLQKVSNLKDPVERELQALPDKDRHQALVHIAALVQKADSKEFGDKAQAKLDTLEKDKAATPRETLAKLVELEATRTPDLLAKLTPLVQELVSSKAITETQATAITEQLQKASEKVVPASTADKSIDPVSAYITSPASPTPQAASEPPVPRPISAEADPTLRNTLAQATASGPDKLSAEQAHVLVSALEALRGKSLAALDDSKGNSPTQTLVRVEGLLQVLGKGDLGAELKAKAQELADPLRQWKQQDAMRYVEADGSMTGSRPKVVAQTKTAESAWHSGPLKDLVRFEDPAQPVKPTAAATAEGTPPATASGVGVAPSTSSSPDAAAVPPMAAASASLGDKIVTLGSSATSSDAPSSTKEAATPPLASDPGAGSTSTVASPLTPVPAETTASKPLSLRDSLEQMAAAGPDKLTAPQAEHLVAALDAIRTKPLATLDGSSGPNPTQTLVRVEGFLKELESGRFGDELKAQAKDLDSPVQKWVQQDAQRYGKLDVLTSGERDSVVAQIKGSEPAWHSPLTAAGPHHEVGRGAQNSDAAKAIGRDTSAPSAQDLAAQRLGETEAAGGRLSMMMSNPPGTFTNRDKSWNEVNIQKAAQEVLKLDPESVDKLSAGQATKLAAYSYWLADKASSGRLPGFDTPEGKERAAQLVSRAGELLAVMDSKGGISDWPKDVAKDLKKADNMVDAREKLDQMSAVSSRSQGDLFNESTAGSVKERTISPQAARSLAHELIDSVYRAPEITETQAKYLLKNAANLTPESLKSLDSQTQAKTAVALSELTEQVRNGAMGDVNQLPGAVQKHLTQAEGAVDKLMSELNKSSGMRQSLQVARSVLDEKLEGPATEATASGAVKDASARLPSGKAGGADMSR